MRAFKIGTALGCLAALGACRGDATAPVIAVQPPSAFVRFVDAVPDTGGMDWRFVDQVENTPTTFNLKFRGVFPGAGYQSLGAGSRHLTVFQAPIDLSNPALSTPAIVSTVFFDTTFNFVAGQHYTIMAAGNIRAGSATPRKLVIFTDDFTDPGASVAVRTVNAGAASSIDIYGSATGGTSALASPLSSSLAQYTASKYTTMTPGPLALRAFTSGSSVFPAMIDAAAPTGVAADRVGNLTAVGGSTIAGSAFTTFFFPRSVLGSIATSFTTPGIVTAVDRYPPSGF
jgi:hypothetical protein